MFDDNGPIRVQKHHVCMNARTVDCCRMSSNSSSYQSSTFGASSGTSGSSASSGTSGTGTRTQVSTSRASNTNPTTSTATRSTRSPSKYAPVVANQSQNRATSSKRQINTGPPSAILASQVSSTNAASKNKKHHNYANINKKFNIFKVNLVKVNDQQDPYGTQYFTFPEPDPTALATMTQYPHYDSNLNSFYYYHYYDQSGQSAYPYSDNREIFYPNPNNPNLYQYQNQPYQPGSQGPSSQFYSQQLQHQQNTGYYCDIDPKQNQFVNVPIDGQQHQQQLQQQPPLQSLVPRSPSKAQYSKQGGSLGSSYNTSCVELSSRDMDQNQETQLNAMIATIDHGIQKLARLLGKANQKQSRDGQSSVYHSNNGPSSSQGPSKMESGFGTDSSNDNASSLFGSNRDCSCINSSKCPTSSAVSFSHPNQINIQRFNQLLTAFKELTKTLGPSTANAIGTVPSEIKDDSGKSKVEPHNSGGTAAVSGPVSCPSNMILMDRNEFAQKMVQMDKMVKEIEQLEHNLHQEMMAGIELGKS